MGQRQIVELLNQLKRVWPKIDNRGITLIEELVLLAEKSESDLDKSEEEDYNEKRFPLPSELLKQEGQWALFADGACRGNPGPGAYGAMAQSRDGEMLFQLSGVAHNTTNNQMEMTAVIEVLQGLYRYLVDQFHQSAPIQEKIFLYTDSQYVVKGVNEWLVGWKRRGWKKSDGKEVMNRELWVELDRVLDHFQQLKVLWVKGHAGHPQNEYCDQLANQALDEAGL